MTSTHSAPDEDAAIDLLKAAYPMNYGNADWVRAYEITRTEAMAIRAEHDLKAAHDGRGSVQQPTGLKSAQRSQDTIGESNV